ncbi:hypothetical protein GCM10023096_01650 [Nonomuraea ferruginea]
MKGGGGGPAAGGPRQGTRLGGGRLRPPGPWESGPPRSATSRTPHANPGRPVESVQEYAERTPQAHAFTESEDDTGGSMCTRAEPMSK